MDCGTYIEQYLSAHVDGELSTEELRAVEEHLAGCANCRARLAEERAVKVLLRERAQLRRTPRIVRGSILAALDAADRADSDRPATRGHGRMLTMRRARVFVPLALAAAALFAFVIIHGTSKPAQAVVPFDIAIDNYDQFATHFEPNVKSTSPADISDAYMTEKLPGFVWNFNQRGYHIIGARLEHLRDGTPVSFTFYRGDGGTILCTYMKSHGLQPPPGEKQVGEGSLYGEHHYYKYKGYSICLSYPPGGNICILVSKRPMKEFVEDIAASL